MHGDSLLMLTTKVVSNKKPPLLSDSESGGSTSLENTDRHYGNFGFIRDVNTLKFIGPAPIFDNGTSLWSQVPGFEIGHWQLCKPFMETQQKQIALVKNFHLKIAGLEQCEEITRQTLLQNPFISKERIDKIANCVGNRVRVLRTLRKKSTS